MALSALKSIRLNKLLDAQLRSYQIFIGVPRNSLAGDLEFEILSDYQKEIEHMIGTPLCEWACLHTREKLMDYLR